MGREVAKTMIVMCEKHFERWFRSHEKQNTHCLFLNEKPLFFQKENIDLCLNDAHNLSLQGPYKSSPTRAAHPLKTRTVLGEQ